MKIKLNYNDIKEKYSDEIANLFKKFIDAVVDEEAYIGCYAKPYDLLNINVEIEITVDFDDE